MLKRLWVYLVAAFCGLSMLIAVAIWAQAVYICYIARDPAGAFAPFTLAHVLGLASTGVLLTVLVVTNTRRPRGIDPDAPPGTMVPTHDRATVDAFSLTTDELAAHEKRRKSNRDIPPDEQSSPKRRHHIILDEEGAAYGRRATDVPIADIKRIIAAVQQIKSADEKPEAVLDIPEWAKDVMGTPPPLESKDDPPYTT